MGVMTVLNRRGDEKFEWDPADKASTADAKKRFADLKEQGYNFYAVEDARGRPVTTFDPKAGRLLAAPGAKSKTDKMTGRRPSAMAGGPVPRAGTLR